MTILRGCDIKWRIRAFFGRYGLKNFPSQNGSRVTLPAGIIGLALVFSECWDKCERKKAKKWRFGDFEVPPDWKEGVKSKNCYDRSIPRAKLPPCTNFQRKIWQNVTGYTLDFFSTIIQSIRVFVDRVFVDIRVFVDTFSAFWKCNKNLTSGDSEFFSGKNTKIFDDLLIFKIL